MRSLIDARLPWVVGLLVIRTKGIFFIMTTLAFCQMLYYLISTAPLAGGTVGVFISLESVPALTLGMILAYLVFKRLTPRYSLLRPTAPTTARLRAPGCAGSDPKDIRTSTLTDPHEFCAIRRIMPAA